jgi:hypothetical protein
MEARQKTEHRGPRSVWREELRIGTNYLADRRRAILDSRRYNILLALGHGAHDQRDEARRHRDRHFRFDG